MLLTAGTAMADTFAVCTPLKLASEMGSENNIVSFAAVQTFAAQSPQYQNAVSGYNSTFMGFDNDWNLNPTNCTVTWHDAAANFLLQKDGQDVYILTMTVNPTSGVVYNVIRHGYASASGIPVSDVDYQGGFYVANASTPSSVTVTYSAAYWSTPTLSSISSGCYWSKVQDNVTECLVDEWTGLQNGTYFGTDYLWRGTNVLVRGGIQGNYTSSTGTTQDTALTEYFYGGDNGAGQQPSINYCGITVSAGNHIYAQTGSNAQFSMSGSDYFVDVINEYNNQACTDDYSLAAVPHYADTVVEEPAGTEGTYILAKFSTVTFTDLEMGTGTGTKFDQYPNYLSDWGHGTEMVNGGYQNTATSSMSEPMGYSYGTFTEYYNSSSCTGFFAVEYSC